MKLILVGKDTATPVTLDFSNRSIRNKGIAIIAATVLLCIGFGYVGARILHSGRGAALDEIGALHQVIDGQGQKLASLESTSRHEMDALAVQLGNLQAQATRLNALGQRLTEVGKLGDGEFNFSKPPALGGAEDPTAVSHSLNFDLAGNISTLRDQFSQSETQLSVLEKLLRDRSLQNSLLPTGYPVTNSYIGSPFGERIDPINGETENHLGLDFDAEAGSDIHAVADGVVVWSGERSGYGNVVEIDHGNGYMTRYAHNQENLVKLGDRISFGQVIAKVGSTGRSTGPHCHFEVWFNGRALNPYAFVKGVVKHS